MVPITMSSVLTIILLEQVVAWLLSMNTVLPTKVWMESSVASELRILSCFYTERYWTADRISPIQEFIVAFNLNYKDVS